MVLKWLSFTLFPTSNLSNPAILTSQLITSPSNHRTQPTKTHKTQTKSLVSSPKKRKPNTQKGHLDSIKPTSREDCSSTQANHLHIPKAESFQGQHIEHYCLTSHRERRILVKQPGKSRPNYFRLPHDHHNITSPCADSQPPHP